MIVSIQKDEKFPIFDILVDIKNFPYGAHMIDLDSETVRRFIEIQTKYEDMQRILKEIYVNQFE